MLVSPLALTDDNAALTLFRFEKLLSNETFLYKQKNNKDPNGKTFVIVARLYLHIFTKRVWIYGHFFLVKNAEIWVIGGTLFFKQIFEPRL